MPYPRCKSPFHPTISIMISHTRTKAEPPNALLLRQAKMFQRLAMRANRERKRCHFVKKVIAVHSGESREERGLCETEVLATSCHGHV